MAGTLWKAPLVWQTVVTIALFLGTSALTIPFNDGRPEVILKYVERLIPLVLVILMVRPGKGTFIAVWLGIFLSIFWYLGLVGVYPIWRDNRLFGPFSSPNSLASVMLVLLPIVLFGTIRYRSLCPKTSFFMAVACVIAFSILLCTGSRNAYFAFFYRLFSPFGVLLSGEGMAGVKNNGRTSRSVLFDDWRGSTAVHF